MARHSLVTTPSAEMPGLGRLVEGSESKQHEQSIPLVCSVSSRSLLYTGVITFHYYGGP